MKILRRDMLRGIAAAAIVISTGKLPRVVHAMSSNHFKVAASHYVGWEPWFDIRNSGLLKKWASKFGITIELDLIDDYINSIELYADGTYDACTMTNMDALAIPAVKGVDSSAIIIGDFSNGNDGIVMKNGRSVKDLTGREILLTKLSVSHYMLVRALGMNGMAEHDVRLLDTIEQGIADKDVANVFIADPNGAVVTWNPTLMQCKLASGAREVFNSSKIPGEIIDLMVTQTSSDDRLKKALVGAWYEYMNIISRPNSPAGKTAIANMANFSSATQQELKAQLRTTNMFYRASEAANFGTSDQLKRTMDYVRNFSYDHGLFGEAGSVDAVGIQFADDSIMGSKRNVKLRFPTNLMEMAASGQLS